MKQMSWTHSSRESGREAGEGVHILTEQEASQNQDYLHGNGPDSIMGCRVYFQAKLHLFFTTDL